MTPPTLLMGFLIATGLVVVAGVQLVRAGEELGDRLPIGRTWVGLVVLSSITSLPELVSSISASAWIGKPDLAVANTFGSNSFNIFTLVILDLVYRGDPLATVYGVRHALAGALGGVLTCVACVALLASRTGVFAELPLTSLEWSVVITGAYFAAMALLYRFESKQPRENAGPGEGEGVVEATLVGEQVWAPLLKRLGAAAAGVLVAGVVLAYLADQLAVYPFSFGTLGETFVGSLGLAVSTSLPEMVVGIAAVRGGSFGMAVGNVFGSNLFNIWVLPICHMFSAPFLETPFYSDLQLSNLLPALLSMILGGIAVAGLVTRSRRLFFGLGWDTLAITILYGLGCYLIFLSGR